MEENFIFHIRDLGYRIMVKEDGSCIQIVQQAYIDLVSPSMEATNSNQKVAGFEELGNDLAQEHDMACNELNNFGKETDDINKRTHGNHGSS